MTIIGYTDLPGRLPAQASQLYGTNLVNLMKLLTPDKDGQLVLDFDDVVQRGMTVVRDGEKTVAAAAGAGLGARRPRSRPPAPVDEGRRSRCHPARQASPCVGVGARAAVRCSSRSRRQPTPEHFTVFVLAIVIGYYVIGKVHHALHTPLMSVTNAISGIIVVGALLQIGHGTTPSITGAGLRRDPARVASTSSAASP